MNAQSVVAIQESHGRSNTGRKTAFDGRTNASVNGTTIQTTTVGYQIARISRPIVSGGKKCALSPRDLALSTSLITRAQ